MIAPVGRKTIKLFLNSLFIIVIKVVIDQELLYLNSMLLPIQ